MGAWEAGMTLEIPPTSCKVLTLMPNTDEIQLISTNRHITQGWVDLTNINYLANKKLYEGTSHIIANDPYQLSFTYPRGTYFKVKTAKVNGGNNNISIKKSDHQGWSTVLITSPQSQDISWEISFETADNYKYATRDPGRISATRVGLDGADISWSPQYYLNSGYQVYLDGELLGYSPDCRFPLRGLDPFRTYQADVRTVWEDGTINERSPVAATDTRAPAPGLKVTIADMLPDEYKLTDLEPVITPRFNFNRPLSFSGNKYNNTLLGWMNTVSDYDIKGLFKTFSVIIGVDDATDEASEKTMVEFIVYGDGREIWRSSPMKKSDPEQNIEINISGINLLSLKVEGPQTRGFRRGGVVAGWANPILKK